MFKTNGAPLFMKAREYSAAGAPGGRGGLDSRKQSGPDTSGGRVHRDDIT